MSQSSGFSSSPFLSRATPNIFLSCWVSFLVFTIRRSSASTAWPGRNLQKSSVTLRSPPFRSLLASRSAATHR